MPQGKSIRSFQWEKRAAVDGRVAEHLFDPQQLVVLGNAVGPRGRAGLDLAGAVATAMSAIVESSVSPLRWLITLV